MMPLRIAKIGDRVEYMIVENKKAQKMFGSSGIPEKAPTKFLKDEGIVSYVGKRNGETYYRVKPEDSENFITIYARYILRIIS